MAENTHLAAAGNSCSPQGMYQFHIAGFFRRNVATPHLVVMISVVIFVQNVSTWQFFVTFFWEWCKRDPFRVGDLQRGDKKLNHLI